MKAEKNFGERISQNCRKSKKNIDLQLDDLIRDFQLLSLNGLYAANI